MTFTSLYNWKILISFPMLLYLHLLLILIVRFLLWHLLFVPIIVTNLTFHSSIDVVSTFDPLVQVMPFGFEVVESIKCESLVREPILKSRFFEIDDKEMEIVNK